METVTWRRAFTLFRLWLRWVLTLRRRPMADKLDKFTERARTVLTLAQEEAQRLNHNYIGTEHLLLGLVREGDGVAARVLSSLGVRLPQVRSAVEFIIGRGEDMVVGEPGLTPRASKVIELAIDEARRLNHHYIGTEHLLLGLVREGDGIGAGVLESLGVSLEQVRRQVMQVVNQSGGYATPRRVRRPQLGSLIKVLPIAQTQRHGEVEITLLALEVYADGFAVSVRVLFDEVPVFEEMVLPALRAGDDQQTSYTNHPRHGPWWHGEREERFTAVFSPALSSEATELRLEMPALRWKHHQMPGGEGAAARTDGPWVFTIALPS